MKLSEQVTVNDDTDVITVCGIAYSGQFFRAFGQELLDGQAFRFEHRSDGVVCVSKLPAAAQS